MLIFAIHIFLYVQTTLFKIFCSAQFVDNNQFSAQFENRKADKSKEKLVVIDTLMGKVIGVNKGPVNLFLGIPYAEPPVGKLRFRPPKPKRHWQSKVYNATHFAPECLQSTLFAGESESRIKDEDCLYLNVFSPLHGKFVEDRANNLSNSGRYHRTAHRTSVCSSDSRKIAVY